MAKKGRFIEKPNIINNWILFANLTSAIMLDFQLNVFDSKLKKNVLIVEYIPTDVMLYHEKIYQSEEDDYDATSGSFKSTYPMDMVGFVEPRTQGTSILMLCNFKGNPCSIIDKINTNLQEQNKKLEKKINILQSILIGINADIDEILKHPQEFRKKLFREAEHLKKALAPAVIDGRSVEAPPQEGKR